MAIHLTLTTMLPAAEPLLVATGTGILDRTNALFEDAGDTLRLGLSVAILVFLVLMMVKKGFTFGTLVMALILGGLAFWIFQGGALPFMGDSIEDQLTGGAVIESLVETGAADLPTPGS